MNLPRISTVRPLPGHYDPTGFKVRHPAPVVKLKDYKITARWPAIDWPGEESFGPEGREHYGVLFIAMKVPGFGWGCWNIEWLHDGERESTSVFMWEGPPDNHTSIWQTIVAKMRGQFSAPDFTVAGFFVAGRPGSTEYMTEPVWLDVQTGMVVEDDEDEEPAPPSSGPDEKADELDELRQGINNKLFALANKWRME